MFLLCFLKYKFCLLPSNPILRRIQFTISYCISKIFFSNSDFVKYILVRFYHIYPTKHILFLLFSQKEISDSFYLYFHTFRSFTYLMNFRNRIVIFRKIFEYLVKLSCTCNFIKRKMLASDRLDAQDSLDFAVLA